MTASKNIVDDIVQPIREDRIVLKAWDVTCPRCGGPQPGHLLRTGRRSEDGIAIRVLECPDQHMETEMELLRIKLNEEAKK